MNKNDWQQIGEDIKRQVQHAIDTNDFSELSKSISDTVSFAASDVGKSLDEVGRSINDIGKNLNDVVNDVTGNFQKGMKQTANSFQHTKSNIYYTKHVTNDTGVSENKPQKWERYNGNIYYAKPALRPDPKLFNNTPPGSIAGPLWMLFGFGAMGIGSLGVVQSLLGLLIGVTTAPAVLPIAATAATAGGVLGIYGVGLKKRDNRFKRYVELVKDKLYCSIEDLAQKTGRSKRFIRRDLKKMMQKGMFLQAHMDKQESCFIASDAMYEQYMLTQRQYEEKALLEAKELGIDKITKNNIEDSDKNAEKNQTTMDSRVAKVLAEGREYVRIIRKCNDDIPGEEMSEKLDRLELLVTRIFARVEEAPELASDLQKMLSYYLPTTQKLLEAYRDLDKQDVEVKNISETKREIEKTVDTMNNAFESFLDDLFRDRAWDIQSDISVLNTMLKQDGYIKSDFERNKKES